MPDSPGPVETALTILSPLAVLLHIAALVILVLVLGTLAGLGQLCKRLRWGRL